MKKILAVISMVAMLFMVGVSVSRADLLIVDLKICKVGFAGRC